MNKAAKSEAPRAQSSAPAAAPSQEAPTAAAKTPPEYPWNVLVKKGADKLPVTVADAAHYERLVQEFGAEYIEVQS